MVKLYCSNRALVKAIFEAPNFLLKSVFEASKFGPLKNTITNARFVLSRSYPLSAIVGKKGLLSRVKRYANLNRGPIISDAQKSNVLFTLEHGNGADIHRKRHGHPLGISK